MARETARSRNPAGHSGLIDSAVGLVSAGFGYLEARAALFAAESRAVLLKFTVIIALAVAALVALSFGYIFVVASLIVGVAHHTGVSWTWIALGAGVLHLLVAAICLLVAGAKLRGRLFPETREELKKDQEWLKTLHETGPR